MPIRSLVIKYSEGRLSQTNKQTNKQTRLKTYTFLAELNNRGPNLEPCGTPVRILPLLDRLNCLFLYHAVRISLKLDI